MKVFVSAGHGGSDPGAVGNGLLEKDCNLQIALAFGAELEAAGVDVVYSRKNDENDPVTEEVREANHSQADYAISFHNNAGGGIGSETWIWPSDKQAFAIASVFENVTVKNGGKTRGIKDTTTLYFIRNTAMPAVLNESAFIDSPDHVRIDTPAKCAELGRQYAAAFLELMGIGAKTENVSRETFLIKAKNKKLYVYEDHDRDSKVTVVITDKRRYTIVDKWAEDPRLSDCWGKLKSGAGWVNLNDVVLVGD